MNVFILFETDFHHRHSSRVILGVFKNKKCLYAASKKIIKQDLMKNGEFKIGIELTNKINWNLQFLIEKDQTQGLATFELVIEEYELNKTIK